MAENTNVAIQQRAHEETPDRNSDAIRQDIAAKRESISETVDKLGDRIQETLDWREYIAQYPAVALGLAAGAGFLVAGIFKRQPTPQERIMDAVAELTEEMTDRVGGVMAGVIQKKIISGRTVKAALAAMAAQAAVDFMKKQMNGVLAGANSGLQSRATPKSAVSDTDTNLQPSGSPHTPGRGLTT